ncbi:MAG: tRNA glutamyl-Q(34) synthetase GluQRS [Mariprofundus sp.]
MAGLADKPLRTRFAPSPTGLLHVGNAYSALACQRWANHNQAELLLRIEDVDHTRCRAEFIDGIYKDLNWLGLRWPEPVRLQSEHVDAYRQAIARLRQLGVIYPCFCTRKSIQQELANMSLAPHSDDSAPIYPGVCRNIQLSEQQQRMQKEPFAWRLDIEKSFDLAGHGLQWRDDSGQYYPVEIDQDVVIGRKDIAFSYHLAVVVDDAIQGITHIIRGVDLQDSTGIHRLLQSLLGLPEPVYMHHPLLCNADGQRLAKRNASTTLNSLRQMGVNVQKLRDFLSDKGLLSWPFTEADESDILNMLGNSG